MPGAVPKEHAYARRPTPSLAVIPPGRDVSPDCCSAAGKGVSTGCGGREELAHESGRMGVGRHLGEAIIEGRCEGPGEVERLEGWATRSVAGDRRP
jgi:hypothetical protein